MRLFFLCMCLAASAGSSAQDFTLTLAGKTIDYPEFPYYVEQVSDAREQPFTLGFVQRGMNNRRVAAYSKEPLADELAGLFARSFGDKSSGKAAIIVRINHLFIYENTMPNSESAFAELGLTFFEKTDSGLVERYTVGVLSEQRGLDVTKKHDDNIVAAVRKGLGTFIARKKSGFCRSKPVDLSALQRAPEAADYPVWAAEKPQAGIIRTFQDFLDNTAAPEKGHAFTLKKLPANRDYPERFRVVWETDPAIEPWGLSDGEYLYRRVKDLYYRLERTGENFELVAPAPPDKDDIMTGWLIGGAIGGAIAASADGPPKRFRVEFASGNLRPLEGPNPRLAEMRVSFFCSFFADAPVSIALDGQELCTLERGTFFRLRLPPPQRALAITLTSNGKTLQQTLTPDLSNTEVCLLRTAKGEPKLDFPDGDLRKKLLRQAADGEMKEKCGQ